MNKIVFYPVMGAAYVFSEDMRFMVFTSPNTTQPLTVRGGLVYST